MRLFALVLIRDPSLKSEHLEQTFRELVFLQNKSHCAFYSFIQSETLIRIQNNRTFDAVHIILI